MRRSCIPGCASNLIGSSHATVGVPARAFADAHTIVSLSLEIRRSSAQPLETRGVLAAYDDTHDLLTVYSFTQIRTASARVSRRCSAAARKASA